MKTTNSLGLFLLLLLLALPGSPARGGVEEGVDYLLAAQNADGSWGENVGLQRRDTAAVLEALRRNGEMGETYERGLAFLRGAGAPNLDFAARAAALDGMGGETSSVAPLWAARRPPSYVPGDANYPEGGWGIAADYQTDVLDTALVLQALAAGGFANGLSASGETLAIGEEGVYTSETPASATSFSATFPALSIAGGSGNLNLWFEGPGGRFPPSGWYQITGPFQRVTWDSGSDPAFRPGLIEVHVRNDAASSGSATFDIELSFLAEGIDSDLLREPVDYLRAARNPGEGWGTLVGADTDLFISLHALIALQTYDRALGTAGDTAPALTWLEAQAQGDGGFGTGPGSTAFETALAYMALANDDPAGSEAVAARLWLVNNQRLDNSWGGGPYETALAVKALPWGEEDGDGDLVRDPFDNCALADNPDQIDSDGDGSGDACDPDDDNDGVLDGASAGDPSSTPFLALDIYSMSGTLPAQPPSAYINFQVISGSGVSLGWWDATNQGWIEGSVSPDRRNMALYVDTNDCFCIDMNDGDTLTPATDNGDLSIWLPDQASGWQGWLYVSDDGSTYFDYGLTSLARAAPTEPGDNCRRVWNPGQYDTDADGTGDACDPDDGEVASLHVRGDLETVAWSAETGALAYNVYRGLLSVLGPSSHGSCWRGGVTRDADLDGDPDTSDTEEPPAGDGFSYLATAEMSGGEGSLGRDSAGTQRVNGSACP